MNTSASVNKHLVGIGGLPRSGKDSLAQYFMNDGYYGVSIGDIVRDFSRSRHNDKPDPISVANMTETSNWLRSERGPDFALQIAEERYRTALKADPTIRGLLVFSIRAPAEVDYLLKHNGALIWMEATDQIRYERAMHDLRKGEVRLSFQEFKDQEALQWQPQSNLPVEVQMNIKYVKEHATTTFINDIDLTAFQKKAQKFVADF